MYSKPRLDQSVPFHTKQSVQICTKPCLDLCYAMQSTPYMYTKPYLDLCHVILSTLSLYTKPCLDLCHAMQSTPYMYIKPYLDLCHVILSTLSLYTKPRLDLCHATQSTPYRYTKPYLDLCHVIQSTLSLHTKPCLDLCHAMQSTPSICMQSPVYIYYYSQLLYSAILYSQADSLRTLACDSEMSDCILLQRVLLISTEVVYWQRSVVVAWLVPREMLPFRHKFCVHHSTIFNHAPDLYHAKQSTPSICMQLPVQICTMPQQSTPSICMQIPVQICTMPNKALRLYVCKSLCRFVPCQTKHSVYMYANHCVDLYHAKQSTPTICMQITVQLCTMPNKALRLCPLSPSRSVPRHSKHSVMMYAKPQICAIQRTLQRYRYILIYYVPSRSVPYKALRLERYRHILRPVQTRLCHAILIPMQVQNWDTHSCRSIKTPPLDIHTHPQTCTHTHLQTCTHTHPQTCTHTHPFSTRMSGVHRESALGQTMASMLLATHGSHARRKSPQRMLSTPSATSSWFCASYNVNNNNHNHN